MPRLTFPFGPDGLLVPALVGLAAPALHALHAQGTALPAPQPARGMLDSGSTVTAVAPWLLAALNAPPGPGAVTRTAAGPSAVRFYQVSFTIYDPAVGGNALTRTDWMVVNLAQDLDEVDILFGLDLLREVVLLIDGPGQTFHMDC